MARKIKIHDIRRYGSHLPLLIKAVEKTQEPILELGMGVSTWVLDMLCQPTGRKLESYEDDPGWFKEFEIYKSDYHNLYLVKDWDKIDILDTYWGVVLVDQSPIKYRRDMANKLRNNAKIILCHDTEASQNTFYGYERIYSNFKYRCDYTKLLPNTTALSNFVDVKKLLED
jgi:hypothetical protein